MKRTLLLLALTPLFLPAQTLYVTPTGTGTGTSWATAGSLEYAVANATPTTEIWVKEGVYSLSAMLEVPAGVRLYGGFGGDEVHLAQRDYHERRSILDAGNNGFGAVRLGANAALNGFTVRNGAAVAEWPDGGGVWMAANASVENCIIRNNFATRYGGGIYAEGDGLIYNTLIIQNGAIGDGMAIYGSTVTLQNNTITENYRAFASCEAPTQPDPEPTTICASTTHTFDLAGAAGGDGTYTYQWQQSADGTTWADAEGASTGATYTTPALTSNVYYRRIVTSCGHSATSGEALITVVEEDTSIDVATCNNNTPNWGWNLGTVSFASPIERTISGNGIMQIWSDAVTATNCQKTNYDGGHYNSDTDYNFNSDCRSNPNYSGDLFSWCAVARYRDVLCPEDWRVPTMQDFVDLDVAMGGTGQNRSSDYPQGVFVRYTATSDAYGQPWGGLFGGFCSEGGTLNGQSGQALYWSLSENSIATGYCLNLLASAGIRPQYSYAKSYGQTLRCVRDTFPQSIEVQDCNTGTPNWGPTLGKVSYVVPGTTTTVDADDADHQTIISGNGISQIWSGYVTTTACHARAGSSFDGGHLNSNTDYNFNADCAQNTDITAYPGDFFSWCAVARYRDVLCPGDWRVPTMQDFMDLDIALGGTGESRVIADLSDAVLGKYTATATTGTAGQFWQGLNSGYIGSSFIGLGLGFNFWSQSEYSSAVAAYSLYVHSTGHIYPQFSTPRSYGLTLRCVRDTEP